MADDEKVVSLHEWRRQQKQRPADDAAETPGDGGEAQHTGAEAGDEATEPVPGHMVWLRCPTCGTLEYTEQQMPGGRVHNACGTQVEEVSEGLDLRAEYTVAELNLERLRMLSELVEQQRARYREYQQRLRQAAGGKLQAYPATEGTLQRLPVARVDGLGLLVSHFLHEPARRFEGAEQDEGGASAAPEAEPTPPDDPEPGP